MDDACCHAPADRLRKLARCALRRGRQILLASKHKLGELVADVPEQRAALRQVVDQPLEGLVILTHGGIAVPHEPGASRYKCPCTSRHTHRHLSINLRTYPHARADGGHVGPWRGTISTFPNADAANTREGDTRAKDSCRTEKMTAGHSGCERTLLSSAGRFLKQIPQADDEPVERICTGAQARALPCKASPRPLALHAARNARWCTRCWRTRSNDAGAARAGRRAADGRPRGSSTCPQERRCSAPLADDDCGSPRNRAVLSTLWLSGRAREDRAATKEFHTQCQDALGLPAWRRLPRPRVATQVTKSRPDRRKTIDRHK